VRESARARARERERERVGGEGLVTFYALNKGTHEQELH
jgi:hypothetical protein